jgi:hypothetical protein
VLAVDHDRGLSRRISEIPEILLAMNTDPAIETTTFRCFRGDVPQQSAMITNILRMFRQHHQPPSSAMQFRDATRPPRQEARSIYLLQVTPPTLIYQPRYIKLYLFNNVTTMSACKDVRITIIKDDS